MARYKPVKLAYKLFEPKCGSDDRLSPIIFLHGLASTNEVTWNDLPQTFADQTKRKAYTVDARNHGDSEWSDEFDYDLNAEDILHFIDEMRFPKVVIVAHSMGGITGIKAALRAPKRIEMLLLEEVSIEKFPPVMVNLVIKLLSLWKEAEEFIYFKLDKKQADNFVTSYIFSKFDPKTRQFYDYVWNENSYPLEKDSSGRYVFKVNLKVILRKLQDPEIMQTHNKGIEEGIYEGPTCFLYASDSAFHIDEQKHQILQHFPGAVFVPFKTSSHFIHKQFPDQIVENFVKFVKQNEKFSDVDH